jgi:hypothetical protein
MPTMRTTTRLLLPVLVLSWLGCATAVDQTPVRTSRVSVTFLQPERFADVKDSVFGSERGVADLLGDLDRYLRAAGDRYLPAGLSLEIRVVNVDLAGEFEPWRGPQFDRVRIMRDIYPPRIDLEFRLTDTRGIVVKEGRRELRDQLYLTGAAHQDSDRLRYDKQLLGNWLREEFCAS